jgi:hypothetical protein
MKHNTLLKQFTVIVGLYTILCGLTGCMRSSEMEVKATIKKMIVLLDEGKPLELLEKHSNISSDSILKGELTGFDKEKQKKLREELSQAFHLKPKSTDTARVVFEHEDFPGPLIFTKRGDYWILMD